MLEKESTQNGIFDKISCSITYPWFLNTVTTDYNSEYKDREFPIKNVTNNDYLKLKSIFFENHQNEIVNITLFKDLIDECHKKNYCNKEDLIKKVREQNCNQVKIKYSEIESNDKVLNENEHSAIIENKLKIMYWLDHIKNFDMLLDCEEKQLTNINNAIILGIKKNKEFIVNAFKDKKRSSCYSMMSSILKIKCINEKIKKESDDIILLADNYIAILQLDENKDVELEWFLKKINDFNILIIDKDYKKILCDKAYVIIGNFFNKTIDIYYKDIKDIKKKRSIFDANKSID